jgi:hypothetical protein
MITEQKWYEAKHGNHPTFTAQVRRQERHYGQPFPVRVGWFRRNLGYIIAMSSCIGVVVAFGALILLTFTLLPGAIEAELDRQIAVVAEVSK